MRPCRLGVGELRLELQLQLRQLPLGLLGHCRAGESTALVVLCMAEEDGAGGTGLGGRETGEGSRTDGSCCCSGQHYGYRLYGFENIGGGGGVCLVSSKGSPWVDSTDIGGVYGWMRVGLYGGKVFVEGALVGLVGDSEEEEAQRPVSHFYIKAHPDGKRSHWLSEPQKRRVQKHTRLTSYGTSKKKKKERKKANPFETNSEIPKFRIGGGGNGDQSTGWWLPAVITFGKSRKSP
jgi:hypothetical protein